MIDAEPTIRAAVEAARRQQDRYPTLWGSVVTWDPLTDQTAVLIDGPDTVESYVVNATAASLSPGQRVLVQFTPPSGAHVIGLRPAPPIRYTPTLTNVDVDDGYLAGEWSARDGVVDFTVLLSLGAAGSVSGQIAVGLPVEGSALLVTEPLILARGTISSARYTGSAVYEPSTSTTEVGSIGSDGAGLWSTTVPAAWSPGDILRVSGRYPMRLPVEDSI